MVIFAHLHGGPDGRSLFVAESKTGALLRAELEVPGLPTFPHAA